VREWPADQFWQNAEDLLQYPSVGRSWQHLPMKSNGLPPPREQSIIDILDNPGRWSLHVGFIEAIGAVMWSGERFWQVRGEVAVSFLSGDTARAAGLWLRHVSTPRGNSFIVTGLTEASRCEMAVLLPTVSAPCSEDRQDQPR
jgi:hypothetical protein